MADLPDVSIVLATHNRAACLPRAIASALAQGDVRLELIVVDDASTDGTPAYLASLADPRIRVIRAEHNLGPSGARNLGVEAARAGIVAFIDSDDAYRPGRLAAPLAAFAREPELVCVLSSAVKFDRAEPRQARIPAVKLAPPAFEWALIADLIPVEATSITVRRAPALAVGGFCEKLRLTEDREFLIRLARKGAGRLLPDLLWEKSWVHDSLSNQWAAAGRGLVAYVNERPEYLGRYRKLGSYLATKVLVGHLRNRAPFAFARDLV
ncbi:MAG: glycosyltransferase family 2 protein, partial [Acetobacteraceae bacterium]|nr:glycosyltransferase family 2 protein [Acetobacteraceae bacterium]